MKKIIVLLMISLTSLSLNAQEKPIKPNKNKKVEIAVSGVCDMCEKRIEKAAYSVKGVKSAEWHADHQDLHLIIDEAKCKLIDVEKAIAKVGHDTQDVKATDAEYDKVHECCKYRTQEGH